MAFVPRANKVDDGQLITAPVGTYLPNAWGLKDMHGNVAEWTRTSYRPYPYDPADGRNDPAPSPRLHMVHKPAKKVVRGGSWRDRPKRARSAFRLAYQPYQRVFNVGFRVICTSPVTKVAASK
jgi:formylglycine-generating enzyme required for sulfatase activity